MLWFRESQWKRKVYKIHKSETASLFLQHYLLSNSCDPGTIISQNPPCVCISCSVMSNYLRPHGLLPASVHGILQQEYWSVLPLPPPGDLPDPGIEPRSPALQADSLLSASSGKPVYTKLICILFFFFFLQHTASISWSKKISNWLLRYIGRYVNVCVYVYRYRWMNE